MTTKKLSPTIWVAGTIAMLVLVVIALTYFVAINGTDLQGRACTTLVPAGCAPTDALRLLGVE